MKRRNWILRSILFAAFCPLVALGQTQDDIKNALKAYDAGNVAISKGDFRAAIDSFTIAINLYPTAPEFFFNRAVANTYVREYDRAISDFDKTLELAPNLPVSLLAELHAGRGTAFQEKGDYPNALNDLNKAISLNPGKAGYYVNRGNTYTFQKKFELALADLNKSLEMQPLSLTFYNRAALHRDMGDNDRSISDYTKAIELSPRFPEAFSNRGLGYQKKGDLNMALRDFTQAIFLNEKDGVYYFNRANINFAKGSFALSIKDYSKAIEIYPLWAEPLRRRANAYKKLGQLKLAAADMQKARTVEKNNFTPVYQVERLTP